eukprot:gnl/MRDRNA2_/MRDRNA2_50449_c0_seq1.p1 gnl/MRDRNA2_/MRDRNA2_50449_c0~~gnl/MRDRNA2_/MRDRNA2_50449_c0_seq1.p1  ORF type:complete len:135 (+),score=19.14 gnl/MRDRNA2_/MRDRNA2_50449_c0_seq1:277-681(+)
MHQICLKPDEASFNAVMSACACAAAWKHAAQLVKDMCIFAASPDIGSYCAVLSAHERAQHRDAHRFFTKSLTQHLNSCARSSGFLSDRDWQQLLLGPLKLICLEHALPVSVGQLFQRRSAHPAVWSHQDMGRRN